MSTAATSTEAPPANRTDHMSITAPCSRPCMAVLFDRLGLIVGTAPALDTDVLGTFTGEIPRAGSTREAAIAKARLGMAATGLPRGIVSERS
ncbi:hypothetical protein [Pseudaminobacter sp. NGMCC 1.201702]|uniref:hypothetical protein n=1 Tax=Pseudaminobacter sp. NGMCC 1.201702 TaxID=3391825 RepID=UPI0039F05998